MRIVAVSPHVQYVGIPHAGGEFLYCHLERMAQAHEVSLLVPATARVREGLSLAPPWLDVVVATIPPAPWRDLSLLQARIGRRLRFRTLRAPVRRAFEDAGLVARASAADVVELHWNDTAVMAPALRRAGVTTPLVVVAYDLNLESVPSVDAQRSFVRRVAARATRPVRLAMDRRDLGAADLVIVFKPEDADTLRAAGVRTPALVIAPPIPLPSVAPRIPDSRPSLLVTGAMWRPENDDGVRWFLERVWPRVAERVPDATFTIAGASPTAALRALAARSPGVEVTGEVADLTPHYTAATGFVAPLFVAGGIKSKVVHAMAHGLATIATPVAAAGIVDVAPAGALWRVTDDPAELTAAAVSLLTDPRAAAATGAVARAWAREHFSAERSTALVLDAYAGLTRRDAAPAR